MTVPLEIASPENNRGLGFDGTFILKNNSKSDIIPECFKEHQDVIEAIKGTPASHFLGALSGYALGFGPFVLGGVLARELTNITPFQRMILAAAPTALGGVLRLWAAQKTDEGKGKEAILSLLSTSVVGLLGIFYFVEQSDVTQIQATDLEYWGLMLSNALSGAGIATFSAAMPMVARSAPNDTIEISNARIHRLTGVQPEVTWMRRFLRKGPADHMGMVAGVGGLMPPIAITTATFSVSAFGLGETYALVAGMTVLGELGLHFFWQNLPLDQLRAAGVPLARAKQIAAWMGQTEQVDPTVTFFQKLERLNSREIKALTVMCSSYIATFGVLMAFTSTGTLMFERRGESKEMAAGLVAGVSAVSTLVRSGMAIPNQLPLSASTLTDMSLAAMAASLLLFAISEQETDWLLCLPIFAIVNGVGLYAVFKQIAEDLPDHMGLASGLAGGAGAFSAIFINIAFAAFASANHMTGTSAAGIPQTDTAKEYLLGVLICTVCCLMNVAYVCTKEERQRTAPSERTTLGFFGGSNATRQQYASLSHNTLVDNTAQDEGQKRRITVAV